MGTSSRVLTMMKIVLFAMIATAAFASMDPDQIVPESEKIEFDTESQQYEFPEDEELVDEDDFATPEGSCDPNKAKRAANDKLAKALQKQIKFQPNKVTIRKASETTLMKVADTLHQFPWLEVDIIGQSTLRKSTHCTRLTTGRAKSVIDYMKSKGIKNKMNAKSQCKIAVAVKIVAAGGSAPIPHAAIKKCKKEKAEKKQKEVADKKAEKAEKKAKAAAKAKELNDKKEKATKVAEKKAKESAGKKEKADKEKIQKAKTKEKKKKAAEAAKKHEISSKEKVSKAEKAAKEAAQKKAEKAGKEKSTKAAEKKSKEHTQKKACNRNTGGTCRIMNCWSSRGATDCKKYNWYTYKCLCKYGSCPRNGKCYDAITGKFTRL